MSADLAASSTCRYLTAIKDKHIQARARFPISASELSAWRRAIQRKMGRATQQELPLTKSMIHRMLCLPTRSDNEEQDVLATAVAALTACRPSDLVNVDVCDFLLSYALDPPGTAALRIWGMKNDVLRKGHHPRIGIARDPRKDVIRRILEWCARHQLAPRPQCSKRVNQSAPCTACGTLFRSLDHGVPRRTSDPAHPLSTMDFTHMVRRVVQRLGYDQRAFTARSCRMCALSVGGNQLLPSYMVTLQSGHSEGNRSAPGYMTITHRRALFALWNAFGL